MHGVYPGSILTVIHLAVNLNGIDWSSFLSLLRCLVFKERGSSTEFNNATK